jgi:hypothetical protein
VNEPPNDCPIVNVGDGRNLPEDLPPPVIPQLLDRAVYSGKLVVVISMLGPNGNPDRVIVVSSCPSSDDEQLVLVSDLTLITSPTYEDLTEDLIAQNRLRRQIAVERRQRPR